MDSLGIQNSRLPGSLRSQAQRATAESGAAIPVRDFATRTFLLTQLVAQLDNPDQSNIAQLVRAGIQPELLDRLRNLTLGDIIRCANGRLGLSINVDCDELTRQLAGIDRARDDRSLYESFVRGGASPGLISRLFGVSDGDVRRLRRLIAPSVAVGGRPKLPEEDRRQAICEAWANLVAHEPSEKQRYWRLSRQFPDVSIVALEHVVAGA